VDWNALQAAGIRVLHVPLNDDFQQQLFASKETHDAINHVDRIASSGQNILVSCAQGKSRSVSLVMAYLITKRGMTYDQALSTLRSQRPIVCPNSSFEYQLRNLERSQQMNQHHHHPHHGNGQGHGPVNHPQYPHGTGAAVPYTGYPPQAGFAYQPKPQPQPQGYPQGYPQGPQGYPVQRQQKPVQKPAPAHYPPSKLQQQPQPQPQPQPQRYSSATQYQAAQPPTFYGMPNQGYPVPNQGYPGPNPGYPSPNQGFGWPQNGLRALSPPVRF